MDSTKLKEIYPIDMSKCKWLRKYLANKSPYSVTSLMRTNDGHGHLAEIALVSYENGYFFPIHNTCVLLYIAQSAYGIEVQRVKNLYDSDLHVFTKEEYHKHILSIKESYV